MITNRRNSVGSSGSLRSASARLVSGPVASPISSPGWSRAARTQADAASSPQSFRSVDGSSAWRRGCAVAERAWGIQRVSGALGHWQTIDAAQIEQAEVVLADLFHADVSAGRGDADEFGVWTGQQINQRDGIVYAGVDVGENGCGGPRGHDTSRRLADPGGDRLAHNQKTHQA